jgi:hypothetical protein
MNNPYKVTMTKKEVFNLFKLVGHTDFSANEIAAAHSKGKDFTFMF